MRLPVMRLGAVALATSLALASSASLAQNAPAKPAAPAAPAAPGAPAGQPAPQPPSKVDLVSPEPQWVKLCGKEQTTGREACQTMRDFGASADQPPMISMQVFELQGEEKRKVRFMILPIGMLLKPGFRVIVDKAEPLDGKYDMCFQNACTAEIDISPSMLANLKKGQNLSVIMRLPGGDPSGRELTLNIPLKDFGTTFDGKPTDPKLLEQQRQALQQQIAEEPKSSARCSSSSSGRSGRSTGDRPPTAAPAGPAPKQ